jgi:hypothetical protein
MSDRLITIRFDMSNDAHNSLVSRIRDFGEVLYREFEATGHASMNIGEIDRAVDRLSLKVTATRHLGEVVEFVRKTLKQHNLAERAQIERAHADA